MSILSKLFGNKDSKGEKDLVEENEELKKKLKACGEKLVEKQEHINKTNAYWKQRLYKQRSRKDSL